MGLWGCPIGNLSQESLKIFSRSTSGNLALHETVAGPRSPSIVVPKGPGRCLALQGKLETFFRGISDAKGPHVTLAKLRTLSLGLPAGLGPVTSSRGKETDKNGRGEHIQ